MRGILIIAVLIVTLMTFYSALWYKSEAIEQDITARVTEELESSGAKAVDIGVDGRHVTLTGIVYDETTEQAYLQTADATYGALGPIDGLTYNAAAGYLVAEKTADGIVLQGVVSNEAARAALVAQAENASDQPVDDKLTVGAASGAWEQEAEFGVSQLAGLTVGTVTASSGAYALSGTTISDAEEVTAALSDRAGWNAFVHSPSAQSDLSGEVSRLKGELTTRDADIATLNETLLGARDDVSQSQALIGERDTTIATLNGEITALTDDAAALSAQTESLNGRVSELEAELNERQAALGSTDEQVVALRSQLSDLRSELGASQQVNDGLIGEIATLTENNSESVAEAARLNQRISELEAELVARQDALGGTDQQVLQLQSDLAESIAQRDVLTEQSSALSDRLAELESDLTRESARAETLEAELSSQQDTVAVLTGQLQTSEAASADAQRQIVTLTAAAVADQKRVTELSDLLRTRNVTTASQGNADPGASAIEQCTEQASAIIERARINFATGTAAIDADSVGVLERLTGIALACAGDAVTVEIGGHTDDRGSDDANQALSEARATAIVAFMAERGVPEAGLRAVGYGESQPIADNETAEGRAENRRISFDWQAR